MVTWDFRWPNLRRRSLFSLVSIVSTTLAGACQSDVEVPPPQAGPEIREEHVGEFLFRYVDNENGATIVDRAKSCHAKLSRGAMHVFTMEPLQSGLGENVDRSIIVITNSTSDQYLDIRTVDVSGQAATWSRLSYDMVFKTMRSTGADEELRAPKPVSGHLQPDQVSRFMTPLPLLYLAPTELEGFITAQLCYFLRIIDADSMSSVVLLSDSAISSVKSSGSLKGRQSYDDILEGTIEATD